MFRLALGYIGEYLMNVVRWLDIGVNVIFLLGSFDETVSERSARARDAGLKWGCVMCKVLDWVLTPVKHNHCDKSLTIRVGDDSILKH